MLSHSVTLATEYDQPALSNRSAPILATRKGGISGGIKQAQSKGAAHKQQEGQGTDEVMHDVVGLGTV